MQGVMHESHGGNNWFGYGFDQCIRFIASRATEEAGTPLLNESRITAGHASSVVVLAQRWRGKGSLRPGKSQARLKAVGFARLLDLRVQLTHAIARLLSEQRFFVAFSRISMHEPLKDACQDHLENLW
jgi:hypothetical protein